MTDDIQSALCGKCRVPIKGPANPKPNDIFACPKCGRSAKLKDVTASIKSFLEEAAGRHLQESMRQSFRGSKIIKVNTKPLPKRSHPFVVDFKF